MSLRRSTRPVGSLLVLLAVGLGVAFSGAFSGAGASSTATENWPRFLGPTGIPVGEDPRLPHTWSSTDNIEWKAEVPGMGWSSPIVWDGRVFVTSAASDQRMKEPSLGVDFSNDYVAELQAEGLPMEEIIERVNERDNEFPDEIDIRLMLYCFDLETGELLWERRMHDGPPPVGRHRKNSYASETPVTDGEAVYVYFAHQGLYAFDLDGGRLWSTPLDQYQVYLEFGGGTSPALHGDRLFIVNDNEESSFIAAFDKRTGEELWRTSRDALVEGLPRRSAWSSPYVWEGGERVEVVTIAPGTAVSYDLDGEELWRMGGHGPMPIPTPFAADGLLYLVSGPPGGDAWPVAAVRPGARGDITLPEGRTQSEDVAWFDWRAGVYLSTPVLYEGALYVLQHNGIIAKHDARTGEVVYRARIAPGAAAFTASPWAYDGKVFALSEEGDTFVMGTGEEYELLGTNALGEFSMATPAMVGDRLLIRTRHHLWSVRNRD